MIKIKKIVLISNDFETKEIEFWTTGINVIIGDSKAGKSSIIQIIDYCLASSDCDIPAGLIRDSCSWFGIVLEINHSFLLLARKSPKGINVSNEMYFEILQTSKIPEFSKIKSNRTREQVKNYFNEHFKLSNLSIDLNEYTKDYSPSYRDTIGINFYPQEILLNKFSYFYKQNNDRRKKNLKFMFSYIMEILTMEDIYSEAALDRIRREILRLERAQEKNSNILDEWDLSSREKLIKAYKLNLFVEKEIPADFLERIKLLQQIKDSKIVDSMNSTEKSLSYLNEEIAKLDKEEASIHDELIKSGKRIRDIRKQKSQIGEFSSLAQENFESRKITDWLLNDEYLITNISKNDDSFSNKIFNQIQNTLIEEESQISFYEEIRVSLDKELMSEEENYKIQSDKLKGVQQLLFNARQSSNETKEVVSRLKELYEYYGELDSFLHVYEIVMNTQTIAEQIIKLREDEKWYEAKINSDVIEERIQAAELYLQGTLDTILDLFNVEYKNFDENNRLVKFDFKKIEFKFQLSNAGVTLDKIGSGSNYVEYHLAMAFLLHIYIQNKVKQKTTFDFVVFDQPSEAYFPTSDENKNMHLDEKVKNDPNLLRQQFRAISELFRQHCSGMQIIIFEHAGREYWENGNALINDKINIIDWKKDNIKLIPSKWIINSN